MTASCSESAIIPGSAESPGLVASPQGLQAEKTEQAELADGTKARDEVLMAGSDSASDQLVVGGQRAEELEPDGRELANQDIEELEPDALELDELSQMGSS